MDNYVLVLGVWMWSGSFVYPVLGAGVLFALHFVHSLVGGLWVLAGWDVIVSKGAFTICVGCDDRPRLGGGVE